AQCDSMGGNKHIVGSHQVAAAFEPCPDFCVALVGGRLEWLDRQSKQDSFNVLRKAGRPFDCRSKPHFGSNDDAGAECLRGQARKPSEDAPHGVANKIAQDVGVEQELAHQRLTGSGGRSSISGNSSGSILARYSTSELSCGIGSITSRLPSL